MAIPMSTTTVAVLRMTDAQAVGEPYAGELADLASSRDVVVSGLRAHLGNEAGSDLMDGGEQERVMTNIRTDPADITYLDWIRDETTGLLYEVQWIRPRVGLGLDHMAGQLIVVTGEP